MFTPSSRKLVEMVKAAEAKFAASREHALRVRFARAQAVNCRVTKDDREHDCRRYINAGDKR